MKEKFITKKFSNQHMTLIDKSNEIINRYARQGYDLSLRQLYYQFIANAPHLLPANGPDGTPNTVQNYKMLGGVISDARLAGLIDWDQLVDRGRETEILPHYDDPADRIEKASRSYYKDLWVDQDWHVEVMVEKQALEGVLLPVCRSLDVPFTANKGYSSSSAMYEAGKRLSAKHEEGKKIAVIYLGDHDPSGLDMSRDVKERLALFAGLGWFEGKSFRYNPHYYYEVVRAALNMDQINQYEPPPNPAKMTDSRAVSYVERFGTDSWELDALDPSVLAGIVRDAVENFVDAEKFNAQVELQEAEREEMVRMARDYRNGRGS